MEWPGKIQHTDEGPVDHTIYEGVFTILEFDILGWLHHAARESDLKWDVVCTLIQHVPLWDLRSWSIIFPSSPWVSLWPFVTLLQERSPDVG